LHFEEPDREKFPCISLAYRALRTGGTLPAAMNAANEEAVQAFLDERISFADIPRIIENVMDEHRTSEVQDLDAVVAADQSARVQAQSAIIQLSQEARVSGVA
jgi:1-deoxy-D-xylulose-5-phosphate reductoisomerase